MFVFMAAVLTCAVVFFGIFVEARAKLLEEIDAMEDLEFEALEQTPVELLKENEDPLATEKNSWTTITS